jgi:hypothetical protein
MAWTDPPSYTNGQIITQTDLHVGLRDNMRELWHEKAYVEFTSTVTATVAVHTEASPLDVVSSGAITYAALPTIVEFFCADVSFGAGNSGPAGFSLWDATDLGRIAGASTVNRDASGPLHVYRRFTPTAASHTYKIRIWATAGTAYASAIAGASGAGVTMPGYIRVWQRGG